MKIIKTLQDLRNLRESNMLDNSYMEFVEEEFNGLMEALGDNQSSEEFSLERDGPIVILESSDDLRDLRQIGLNPQDGGLLGSQPEYVETYDVGRYERLLVRKISILANNEYMLICYLQDGIHPDRKVEAWLEDQTEYIYRVLPSRFNKRSCLDRLFKL